jgi:hypothetical protein
VLCPVLLPPKGLSKFCHARLCISLTPLDIRAPYLLILRLKAFLAVQDFHDQLLHSTSAYRASNRVDLLSVVSFRSRRHPGAFAVVCKLSWRFVLPGVRREFRSSLVVQAHGLPERAYQCTVLSLGRCHLRTQPAPGFFCFCSPDLRIHVTNTKQINHMHQMLLGKGMLSGMNKNHAETIKGGNVYTDRKVPCDDPFHLGLSTCPFDKGAVTHVWIIIVVGNI